MAIYLSNLSESELELIGTTKMEKAVEDKSLDANYVPTLITFHSHLSNEVNQGKIGSKGDCVNLRDIEKLVLVIKTTSEFYRLSQTSEKVEEIDKSDMINTTKVGNNKDYREAVNIEGLRTCLDLVYAKRFPKDSDRREVRKIIDQHFPFQANISMLNHKIQLDLNEFVRIGFIYLRKGNSAHLPTETNFYYTDAIYENVLAVAAAIRTELTILIHGGNSAGKSALLLDLARICNRKIINFQMTKDTTISDLIGSWTVSNDKIILKRLAAMLMTTFQEILNISFKIVTDVKVFQELASFHDKHRIFFIENEISKDLVTTVADGLCELFASMKKKFPELRHEEAKQLTEYVDQVQFTL